MNTVVQLIKKKTGSSIADFCEEVLSCEYKAFSYRLRNNRLSVSDIKAITSHCSISMEELEELVLENIKPEPEITKQQMDDAATKALFDESKEEEEEDDDDWFIDTFSS